jgi:putative transcriptional regulator
MKEPTFKKLLKSIDEAREIHAGKRKPSRIFHIKPIEIKSIRYKLHVSQGKFAAFIGISQATLRNWEQGRTYPDGAARTLLRVAAVRPDAIREALQA